jgi:hypothetical protein
MNDALAIANLKARYCLASDSACGDADGARAQFDGMFTPDFVGDYGFGAMNGPEAIVGFMCGAIGKGSEWMIHALGSPRIDGDRASGDWTITVQSRRRNGEGLMTVYGRYADRFVRTAQGWQIAAITFTRYE